MPVVVHGGELLGVGDCLAGDGAVQRGHRSGTLDHVAARRATHSDTARCTTASQHSTTQHNSEAPHSTAHHITSQHSTAQHSTSHHIEQGSGDGNEKKNSNYKGHE